MIVKVVEIKNSKIFGMYSGYEYQARPVIGESMSAIPGTPMFCYDLSSKQGFVDMVKNIEVMDDYMTLLAIEFSNTEMYEDKFRTQLFDANLKDISQVEYFWKLGERRAYGLRIVGMKDTIALVSSATIKSITPYRKFLFEMTDKFIPDFFSKETS